MKKQKHSIAVKSSCFKEEYLNIFSQLMVVRQNIFLKLLNYYPFSFCFWPHFSLCLIFCSLTAY